MVRINKRKFLQNIGALGGSAIAIPGMSAAIDSNESESEPLEEAEVWKLLRNAVDERPFQEMYTFLVREGYHAEWDRAKGWREEIQSTKRPVLLVPFQNATGKEAKCIIRFDERKSVGVEALVPKEQGYTSYYSSDDLIEHFDQGVIDSQSYRQFVEGRVSTQDIEIGCKTVGGAEICAAIAVLGAAGSATVTLLSPVPGDEAAVIANLGKVETIISGACGLAELIDGYIDCEPDNYKVCLYTANLFFPYVTIKPLC